MKAICLVLLLVIAACQEHERTKADAPNAVRDLLIDRSFWHAKKAIDPRDSTLGVHRFTITNTSQRYVYQHIRIRFDYSDRDHHKIDSAVRIVERIVEPRTAIRIEGLATKSVRKGAITATATVINASAD